MTVPQFAAVQFLYYLQKASLFLFILSVNSDLNEVILLGILKSFWRARWTLWSDRAATSDKGSSQLVSSHVWILVNLSFEGLQDNVGHFPGPARPLIPLREALVPECHGGRQDVDNGCCVAASVSNNLLSFHTSFSICYCSGFFFNIWLFSSFP